MFRIDVETCSKEIYNVRDDNPEYKQAVKDYLEALESGDKVRIDDAVTWAETVAMDTVFKKSFHAGMKFILDVLTGKEVIDI